MSSIVASRCPAAKTPQQQPTPSADDEEIYPFPVTQNHGEHRPADRDNEVLRNHRRKESAHNSDNISISASSVQAELTVAPFLAQHIPEQYSPAALKDPSVRQPPTSTPAALRVPAPDVPLTSSTKYCYRHRPDLKCRRQANEPSMEQLQNELATLSQSDQQAISHVWSLFSAAPAKHRNLMLQGVLTQCCFPQLSFISANVRDLIKIDFLAALPPELGYKILCHLDTTSLCKAAQVSQRWRSLADDDVVWHRMCEQHIDRKCTKCGWGLPLLERKRLRIEQRQMQLRATGKNSSGTTNAASSEPSAGDAASPKPSIDGLVSPHRKRSLGTEDLTIDNPGLKPAKRLCSDLSQVSSPTTVADGAASGARDESVAPRRRPWKDVYKDRFKVGTAWKYGRCKIKTFKGHSNGITCLQFEDNILITGSYDSTVKVWDIDTGEELRTLRGHRSGIRCLQFDNNKLMTGSLDSTLKLWDWKSGTCLRTFSAHTDGIISLHFTSRYVVSGSKDETVRVWDSGRRETFLLRGHTDWVNCVKVDEPSRTLFTASDDLTIRIWDLETKECVRIFEGHVGQVQQVLPMPTDFELDVPDRKSTSTPSECNDDDASGASSPAGISNTHQEPASAPWRPFWPDDPDRPAPPRYMLSGALDSTIRLWDTHCDPLLQPPYLKKASDTTSGSVFLPTDPATNSHRPRAQACVRTFFGHVEGIWALSVDHLRLISGSEDSMLKVWDPRTGKCERTFTGHQGPVTCAWLGDSRVASGSEDCDVRMLCFDAS